MIHDKEKMADWIYARYANDYFRFELITADLIVKTISRSEKAIVVEYQFLNDETRVDDRADLILFKFDPENHRGSFPKELFLVTLKDKYSWDTIEKCDSLDPVNYLIDEIDWDVEALSWDDCRISDQTIENFMSRCDGPAIGETLVKCFSANISMPDFIPVRLHKYFAEFVNEFLSQT